MFARKRLSRIGRKKFWKNWSSEVHTADSIKLNQRKKMYELDYDFISNYMAEGSFVLDVGCGEGDFLDLFRNNGHKTFGVEFGHQAAEISRQKHKCYEGVLPDLDITESFDLIIFRGTLQYFENLKSYIDKAVSLLTQNGLIFITAQPNMDSFCFTLFKGKFPVPVTGADFIHYTEPVLDKYFCMEKGLKKISSRYFYEETPYADVENDVLKVARAIECKRSGKKIDFTGPAFWGNMMSLVYRKE